MNSLIKHTIFYFTFMSKLFYFRSLSYNQDKDSATEDSDLDRVSRRRRKTWDESRQESLSSDLSRYNL